MRPLAWHPAPYTAGAIDGEGLRRLLGASVHDRLSLLVRETIQNSWDASRAHDGAAVHQGVTPSYAVSLREASEAERTALLECFAETPIPGLPLIEELRRPTLRLLEITDRGTSGLGGPIDNSRSVPDGLPTDFIDLMFNVGAPQDTDLGGGTFGFGKIASYAVSRASSVVVHTHPLVGRDHGQTGEARLLASAIGSGFDLDGRRHTGRHWWGATSDPPTPLLGDPADAVASQLFESSFGEGQTGTSILIIQPDLEDLDDERAAERIVSAILWNAWPKLVPLEGATASPMEISVRLNGEAVEIPDPAVTRPFIGFTASLKEVRRRQAVGDRTSTGWHRADDPARHTTRIAVHSVDSKQPARHVGLIAATESMTLPHIPAWTGDQEEREASGITAPLRHLAMMRQAELVVTYITGPEHPDAGNGLEWSGVFRCGVEHDRLFALSEPPSHDEWLVGGLESRTEKVIVRRGRERGPSDFFTSMFAAPERDDSADESDGVAHVVDEHLAGIVSDGLGRDLAPRSSGGGGGGGRSTVRVLAAEPTVVGGRDALRVEFEAPKDVRLSASGAVRLAGGGRDEAVELLGWGPSTGSAPTANGTDWVSTGEAACVWFEQPSDATVTVDIREAAR